MIYVEMTDTLNGEANYSWVKKMYITTESSSMRTILKEIRNHFELGSVKMRKGWNSGDTVRYDLDGCCICIFITFMLILYIKFYKYLRITKQCRDRLYYAEIIFSNA